MEKKRRNGRWIGAALVILAAACLTLAAACSRLDRDSRIQPAGENGKIRYGYQEIAGQPYYFNKLGRFWDKGWIEGRDNRYYCLGEGQLATGWRYMGDKAYYFYQAEDEGHRLGAQARNYTTSGKITIPECGYLEGDEAMVIGYALDVLDRYGWTLKDAYKYSGALRFQRNPEEVYGFKIVNCALQGFKYGKGNCLSWAGTFCVMAKVMGYDCRLVWGTLPFQGEDVPHGWAEIWEEDGIHVYDPRRNDGDDMTGFDQRYGEKGSLRYSDKRQYLDW